MDRHRIGHVFVLTGSAAPSDCLLLGAVYKFAYLLTYLCIASRGKKFRVTKEHTHTHTHTNWSIIFRCIMWQVTTDHRPPTNTGQGQRTDWTLIITACCVIAAAVDVLTTWCVSISQSNQSENI